MTLNYRTAAAGLVFAAMLPLAGWAQTTQTTITLQPSQDTALFEEGDLSNALGPHLYAGQTNQGNNRRSLLAFDFSTIPVTATVDSATLTLNLSLVSPGSSSRTMNLHRVNGSWSEGTSDAGSPGGTGASATNGDATWTDRIFPGNAWISPGGDFEATPSATTNVLSLLGPYDFTGLETDVQAWISGTAVNSGWILIGEEDNVRTALRFDSRENPTATAVPSLSVTYTAPAPGGGTPTGPTAVPGPGPVAIVLLMLGVLLVSRRWL